MWSVGILIATKPNQFCEVTTKPTVAPRQNPKPPDTWPDRVRHDYMLMCSWGPLVRRSGGLGFLRGCLTMFIQLGQLLWFKSVSVPEIRILLDHVGLCGSSASSRLGRLVVLQLCACLFGWVFIGITLYLDSYIQCALLCRSVALWAMTERWLGLGNPRLVGLFQPLCFWCTSPLTETFRNCNFVDVLPSCWQFTVLHICVAYFWYSFSVSCCLYSVDIEYLHHDRTVVGL
jgi:hypothetical protein